MRRAALRMPDLFVDSLGEVLRSRRRRLNLSQQVLSVKAGLAPHVVGNLERGNRTLRAHELVQICAALGVPSAVFLEEVKKAQLKALHPIEEELRRSRACAPGSDAPGEVAVEVTFFHGTLRMPAQGRPPTASRTSPAPTRP